MIAILKSLSDSTRLRILNLLDQGELCVCDIMNVLELPQSTVSRHLSILKANRFISSRKQGLWHYYRIDRKSEIGKDMLRILKKEWSKDPVSAADLKKLKSNSSCDSDSC